MCFHRLSVCVCLSVPLLTAVLTVLLLIGSTSVHVKEEVALTLFLFTFVTCVFDTSVRAHSCGVFGNKWIFPPASLLSCRNESSVPFPV